MNTKEEDIKSRVGRDYEIIVKSNESDRGCKTKPTNKLTSKTNVKYIDHIHYSKKLKEHDQHHLWYVDTLRSSC